MRRKIHSMTSAQTRLACDAGVALTREWLLARGATHGRYGGAGAYADLDRDCYVVILDFEITLPAKDSPSGVITWQLDDAFAAKGEPSVRYE